MSSSINWQSIAFDWNQVRAFLATAEEGTLSAAARALNQTQPTIGRQVAALEAELGVVLFERVGRSLILTRSGIELLDHVRVMGDAAARISLTASSRSQIIEGEVRITASDILSAYLLPEVAKIIRERAPLLDIDIVSADDIRDLQRREADIAIRHLRPEQPELIARLICNATAHFYAATSYLERHGNPSSPNALAQHDFISFGSPNQMLTYLKPYLPNLKTSNIHLSSENGVAAWEMAKAGLGIIVMSKTVAEATPGMERVLQDIDPISFPIWLTTHRELHTSRRIRLVFDILADYLLKKIT